MKNARMQAWLTRPNGLAAQLRLARGGLSVRDLAKAAGWQSSSKVSRLETGSQIPTEKDVNDWADATKATKVQRTAWLKELQEVTKMRSTFRRRQDATTAPTGDAAGDLEAVATFVRCMEPNTVPELLRTGGYARAMLKQKGLTGDALDRAFVGLQQRQAHLTDSGKRFEFIIGEGALRYVPGDVDVMGAQLDRLISASDLSNVRLGIIPMLTPLEQMLGPAPFAIYDGNDALVNDGVQGMQYSAETVGGLSEQLNLMWQDAAEGENARRLILAAKAALQAAN